MALAGATAGLDQAVSGLKESRSKQHSLDKPRDPADILMDTQVTDSTLQRSPDRELKIAAFGVAGFGAESWLCEEYLGLED
jgi:hypothetical protein